MHHGVVFPQTEFGNDPEKIKAYAQAAEALGYDYLLVYDLSGNAPPIASPGSPARTRTNIRFHKPMVLFG